MITLKKLKINPDIIQFKNNVILVFAVVLISAILKSTAISQINSGQENCCGQCNNCTSVGGYQSPKYAHPTDFPTPVELSSFTASIERNDVTLMWTTASELNNSGFDVERTVYSGLGGQVINDWKIIGNVKGIGSSSEPSNYIFKDQDLSTGKYKYRLKQTDFNGNFTYYYLSGDIVVGIPKTFRMSQNYPNPFNPMTRIDYDLPFEGKVRIILYDILGRELYNIVNETKQAGFHSVNFNSSSVAGGLSSGAYFYKISAKDFTEKEFTDTKMMMVIK